MKIKEAKKFVSKQIADLERATYMFENVVLPRYEADKNVLKTLKEQYFYIEMVEQKVKSGLSVPDEELNKIPVQFR